MRYTLRLTGAQRETLRAHLFPGDGLEAAAVARCGRRSAPSHEILTVHEISLIPHGECSRGPAHVTWPLGPALPLFHAAADQGMAILKIHSHPRDVTDFSPRDSKGDSDVLGTMFTWTPNPVAHVSAFMLEHGRIVARAYRRDGTTVPIDRVSVIGDAIELSDADETAWAAEEHDLRNVQTFGKGTVRQLKKLSAGVVGTSGTGSWVVEMLARLGVGRLLLVDPDRIEGKNLNRIVNSTRQHVREGCRKVDALKAAVEKMEFGTAVGVEGADLRSATILLQLAECDVLFGCVDSPFPRSLLNALATYYTIPYFDVGVRLVADGKGGISSVYGGVHYLVPGGSTLFTRAVISYESVRADCLRRYHPEQYQAEVRAKYIEGIDEESPAVIPVNGVLSSHMVMEFLARLHPFRCLDLDMTRGQMLDLATCVWSKADFSETDPYWVKFVGRGDRSPLLGDPTLT